MRLAIVGAQWGDEGKGRVVDYLAASAPFVVRFSGGANAGHTIVHEGRTYRLHLIPSGVLYPNTVVALGVGMVIDPVALFRELDELETAGVDWKGRVRVSDRAHIVLPGYGERDRELDGRRRRPIGTTGRGIGVAYAQKAARDGLRVADLFDPGVRDLVDDKGWEMIEEYRERLRPLRIDLVEYMAHHATQNVLLEGAQGILLDLDFGTYPFVSSGMSAAAGAAVGAGIGPRAIDRVVGVFKAYSTRVGNGPFPSEFRADRDGGLEDLIRTRGHEYGATTGRPRRCGYLDLFALRYAVRGNSIDSLVMTHLDVYDVLDQIRVCVGYEVDGERLEAFPASLHALERAEPILKSFDGWKCSVSDAQRFDDLPDAARRYVDSIAEFVGVPIEIVTVGSDREQTIVRTDPWTQS